MRPSQLVPAPTTAAPGLTMSGVTSPARPAAATTTSALAHQRGHVLGTPVWTTVTAALQPGRFERQQQGQRAADGQAPADDDDVPPLDRDVVGLQQLDDAGRRARQRPGRAHDQACPG